MAFSRSTERKKIPNSSDEARTWEARRNVTFSSPAENTPPKTCELPTSRQSSMASAALGRSSRKRHVVDQPHAIERCRGESPAPMFLDVLHREACRLDHLPGLEGIGSLAERTKDACGLFPCRPREQ